MKILITKIHEVWLETLMASFMSRTDNKRVLYDFSMILFRHLTWLSEEMLVLDEPCDYEREVISINRGLLSEINENIFVHLSELSMRLPLLSNKNLSQRMNHDISYIQKTLEVMDEEIILAFNMERKIQNISISTEARGALTRFLFEEIYKKYEHLIIYLHIRTNSKDAYISKVFQTLIEENFCHIRHFGEMMATMGTLSVPRVITEPLCQDENILGFLENIIEEELSAQKRCQLLCQKFSDNSKELKEFFDFIANQEAYHITLIKDVLEYIKKENNV